MTDDGESAPTNWAGNVTYRAATVHRPASVDEVRDLVGASQRIRALGTGHSFSTVADTTGDLVSLAGLPPRVDVADDRRVATVSAGLRYGELAPRLHAEGLALHNMGSLPHIGVAGAVATGTHGSGDRNGSLATAVVGLELVSAGGDLLVLDRSDPRFAGAVVALGALGVVTALTLAVEPAYDMVQEIYNDVPTELVRQHLDGLFAVGDSVSVFTRWDATEQVWVKRRVRDGVAPDDDGDWLGTVADGLRRLPARAPTGEGLLASINPLGEVGPWHERLPHFRLDHTPSFGDELQSELFVRRRDALPALDAVAALSEVVVPALLVSELRTVAADDLWLSPTYERDALGIHFTWSSDASVVLPAVAAVEEALAPFDARPHWGKVSRADLGAVAARYPRHADACRLRAELDPDGVFGNDYVDAVLAVRPSRRSQRP